MPKTQKTAAGYARVSTSGQSVELQIEAIRARYPEAKLYTDEAVSGATTSRPGLDELVAACLAGEHDAFVVWRLDRVGRGVAHVVGLLDSLREAGVEFVSLTEGIDTSTPAGRMVMHLIAAFAEMERAVIRERVQAGMDRARRQGTRTGRAIGRPRAEIDIESARTLLAQPGANIARVARALGTSPRTLRRRLEAEPPPEAMQTALHGIDDEDDNYP